VHYTFFQNPSQLLPLASSNRFAGLCKPLFLNQLSMIKTDKCVFSPPSSDSSLVLFFFKVYRLPESTGVYLD